MKKLSNDMKELIVERCLSGESITSLAKEYSISRGSIYNWMKKYKIQKKIQVNTGEFRKLKQKCDRLERMIHVLQESPFIQKIPLNEKLPYLKQLHEKDENIHLICEAFSVPRGTFYNYVFRGKQGNTQAAQRREELLPLIEKIFSDSDHRYGAGKVAAVLNSQGHNVSERLIARIMHENGMFSVRGGAKKQYVKNMKENVIRRDFNPRNPNEVWVSDVTFFRVKNKQYYICVIIDLFARKVVGYNISLKNNTYLTKRTFKEAYAERNPQNGLIFHSDNGSNYVSAAFTGYLKSLNVIQSFSKPGIPYDNSVCESFFKNMKVEELYRKDYTSERHFKDSVDEYIRFYNQDRPHSANRNCTPDKKEADYFAKYEENKQ